MMGIFIEDMGRVERRRRRLFSRLFCCFCGRSCGCRTCYKRRRLRWACIDLNGRYTSLWLKRRSREYKRWWIRWSFTPSTPSITFRDLHRWSRRVEYGKWGGSRFRPPFRRGGGLRGLSKYALWSTSWGHCTQYFDPLFEGIHSVVVEQLRKVPNEGG